MLKVQCERSDCQGASMQMSDRHGIEIDYCPMCRGVWLDRGELDKIIERAAAYEQQAVQRIAPPAAPQPPVTPPQPAAPAQPYPAQAQPPYPPQPSAQPYPAQGQPPYPPQKPGQYPPQPQPGMVIYDDDYWEDYHKRTGHYPKKKTFLGEMFDIFD
jgi:hypothetical protein